MTDTAPVATDELETKSEMDTSDVIKQADKLAKADNRTIQNYFFIIVLGMFMTLFFMNWRQNSASPDKLIGIMERSVQANSDSLKVQEQSLAKIQEFSIRVPMEHADMLRKVELNGTCLAGIKEEQSDLREAVRANTEAVQANTAAVAKLIAAMEERIQALPKNASPPSS